MEDAQAAFRVLKPSEVIWHHEQPGIIPNTCPEATALGQPSYYRSKKDKLIIDSHCIDSTGCGAQDVAVLPPSDQQCASGHGESNGDDVETRASGCKFKTINNNDTTSNNSDDWHTGHGQEEKDEDGIIWGKYGIEGSESLYWQLYKSRAAFLMAKTKEEEANFRYDWIIRTRFDLAWLRPLPSLRAFRPDAVWFGVELW